MPQSPLLESFQTDKRIRTFAALVLIMLSLYLLFAALSELKSYRYIGSGVAATNTINVSGEGEVFAVPDTATFSVTVQETAKDVETAQTAATTKGNAIIAYLKGQGIDEKDIQTTDYSVNPQYEYQNTACAGSSGGTTIYCPPGKQVLTGFEVSQTLTVKVRDTSKAGALLSGVGSKGASSVSGLSFTVDDQDALEAQARDKAIQSAKAKAEVLAKSLGVSIVRVVGFNENQNYPIYAQKATFSMAADSAGNPAPSPEIPVGQNKITSNVNVTYEIR
jgi:uncharacterized protein YggE